VVNWSCRKVLVTGGCGHIGSFVVRKLLQRNVGYVKIVDNLLAYPFDQLNVFCKDLIVDERVELIKADIADREAMKRIVQDIDIVFHLAAYADVAATIYNPDEDFRTNVMGTYNILKSSLDAGVKKFIFGSSAAVYGDQKSQSPSEPPRFSEDMKPNPLSTYANSKLWGETQAMLFYKLYGLPTVSLRYFSIYGPLQIPKPKSHSWVVAIFIMRALNKRPLIVFGGGQIRDFIHVEDVAEATIRAAEREGIEGEIINVGTGRPTRVDDLAVMVRELAKEELGFDVEIKYGPRPRGDPLGGYADISKMMRLLELKPRSFEEGLLETFKWILSNRHVIPRYVIQ
jgi:UDP-glucose 4-epimerase/dTDP-L-rhamnose 4-epimerase